MADLAPIIVATHAETRDSFTTDTQSRGEAGHYVARLNFPQAGTWNWYIRAFTIKQPMPPLVVIPAPAERGVASSILSPQILVAGFGLTIATAIPLLFLRRKTREVVVFLVVALLFIGVGFALVANQFPKSTSGAAPALSPVERGEALFLAKGCITCHMHARVAAEYDVVSGISGPAGTPPDLSEYLASPEFLRLWLADPVKVKPESTMPNLELTDEKIESIAAFLLSDPISVSLNAGTASPPDSCPVTQPQKPPFIPPPPHPPDVPSKSDFWYGTDELWTLLRADGTWWGLPYHGENGSHYSQKVFWLNKDYDWQSEPLPEFTLTARRLDGPAPTYKATKATNAYHPDFGSAILLGIEVPPLGCWEFIGNYRGHSLSFVVNVVP